MQSPAEGGASAFISGREVLLAAVFLVLGGLILWFVVTHGAGTDSDTLVAEGSVAQQETAVAPEEPSAAVPAGSTETGGSEPSEAAPSGAGPAAAVESPSPSAASLRAAEPVPQRSSPPPPPEADAPPQGASRIAESELPAAARPSAQQPPRPAPAATTQAATKASSSVPRPASQGVIPPAAGEAIALSDLRILAQNGGLEIFAATEGVPQYKMFRVENPNRIVIDMPGTWLEVPRGSREQQVASALVQQVRIAQNQLDPPLVRMVLEVSSFPELQIAPRADGLMITVRGQ